MSSTPERTADEKGVVTDVSLPSSELGTTARPDMDFGLKILEDRGDQGEYVLDPAMRKRILRKIDLHILPILT